MPPCPAFPSRLLPLLVVLLAACRFPQDTEGTLEQVSGGRLEVGLTENPPWVMRTPTGPAGVEVELVRELAAGLDAEVRWHWGTEGNLVEALRAHRIHLAVGGIEDAPWRRGVVATSRVFFRDLDVVGFAPGTVVPESLAGRPVAVTILDRAGRELEAMGARPVYAQAAPDLPVAGPMWQVRARGLVPGPWTLGERRHVWLLPPGENGWILHVDRHLARHSDLAERLRRAERP